MKIFCNFDVKKTKTPSEISLFIFYLSKILQDNIIVCNFFSPTLNALNHELTCRKTHT